jgi:endonuclease G
VRKESNVARRRAKRPQTLASVLITATLVIAYLVWHSYQVRKRLIGPSTPGSPTAQLGPNDFLGRPRFASPKSRTQDYFLDKNYFVLSYNSQRGEPNWVSWRLSSDDLGKAPRKQLFDTDATLPADLSKITSNDYRSSGFDRGHMCPHSDRSRDQASSFATFVMTNIIPQAPNVNQRAWEQLEEYSRALTRQHNRLYITSGPAGEGGTGKEGFRKTIANGKVVVPASCWKIIVVVDSSSTDDRRSITPATRVIAVNMPNDNSVGDLWTPYRTSVAAIESLTGLVFFDALSPDVAGGLKGKVDQTYIPAPVPARRGGE